MHGECHQTQNKISQISGKLFCWSRERTLRDLKERNKGLPVSQASVGGWSKCNPKYSILFLYIFQDVWSCLYSGFCLNCHVCGCHFGLQVMSILFESEGSFAHPFSEYESGEAQTTFCGDHMITLVYHNSFSLNYYQKYYLDEQQLRSKE